MDRFPQSLIEFQQTYGDEDACIRFMVECRWPEGLVCLKCGSTKAWPMTGRLVWECGACGRQASLKHLATAIQVHSNESQAIHPIQEFLIETSQSIQALVGNWKPVKAAANYAATNRLRAPTTAVMNVPLPPCPASSRT
ncbi:transposase [Bradyrhizobium nitroreducens]|uniref:transposase n=1 Tax=Bradyrhizobium nitroreducens TaxID=709803 RepID=UPI000C1E2C9A